MTENKIPDYQARVIEVHKLFSPYLMEKIIKVDKYFSGSKCSVSDGKGNHCPDTPIINIDEIFLCEKCYKNYLDGAYSKGGEKKCSAQCVKLR